MRPGSPHITECENCQGPVNIIACIEDPVVIEKILRHLRAREGEPGNHAPGYQPCAAGPAGTLGQDLSGKDDATRRCAGAGVGRCRE